MEILLYILIGLALGGLAVYFLKPKSSTDETGLKLILQQINELNRTVDSKIGESTRHMNESVRSQLGESANLIREVTKGLTKLDETNRQVVSFADQLQNLQDILKKSLYSIFYLFSMYCQHIPYISSFSHEIILSFGHIFTHRSTFPS